MARKSVPRFIEDKNDCNEALFMHDIARLMRRNFDREARKLGLTRAQWMIIGIVRRFPGIKQAELAERMEVEAVTVGRTLDRMEKEGWIERRADKQDRRAKRLHLTPRVKTIATRLRSLSLAMRKQALAGITRQQHNMLIDLLTHIKSNLCTRA